MKIFGFEITRSKSQQADPAPEQPAAIHDAQQPEAIWTSGQWGTPWTASFNGEKTPGELGPIIDYVVDHAALRARAWQLFLESDVCLTVLQRYRTWVIGEGLKLKTTISELVLKSERVGIPENIVDMRYLIEKRFETYSNSTSADYAGMQTLQELADRTFQDATTGGDSVCVLRVTKTGNVTVQIVDGAHLGNPNTYNIIPSTSDYIEPTTKNRIRNGIEIDATGRHVAFHFRAASNEPLKFERVPARNKDGMIVAFVVYGLKRRIDDTRGLPLITAVMEKSAKLDRYTEATIGSAEERQKIPYVIEHDATSDNTNPLEDARLSIGRVRAAAAVAIDNGDAIAERIHLTTGKQTYNLGNGQKMKAIESDNELNFESFHRPMVKTVCSAVNIPYSVAFSDYDGSYSSSRAAIKDWEHTLKVRRRAFANEFYQNVYNLWLYVQALSFKIDLPGYVQAIQSGNLMGIAAYQSARWIGANVPHIDPVKEVTAERLKLGTAGAHLPLTTLEQATETLNGGEADVNIVQFGDELEDSTNAGILPVTSGIAQDPQDDHEED